MPAVKKGGPEPLTRRGRAKITHWRIVKAAYEAFCERGYAGTTMAHVADRAGVAVQTVYFVFHTKAALLSRAIDFAVMGEGEPRIPQQQPWYARMVAEPDLTIALRHMVEGVGEIIRRVTPLYLIVRAGVESESETASVGTFHEEWRADNYRQILGILQEKAPLRAGMTPERATHLLLLYVGMDVYHVLVDTYGWTPDEWADWAVETIVDQVFERADGDRLLPS
jgi:AcrR family transcriptional regulator